MKNDGEIIEAIPWIRSLSMYKQWIYTKKRWFFWKKTMKAYFKAVILSPKIYENTLKLNFLIRGIRHTDCLRKFFKTVIYRCKKGWRCLNFMYKEPTFLFIKTVLAVLQKSWWYKGKIIWFPAKINYAIHRKLLQIYD